TGAGIGAAAKCSRMHADRQTVVAGYLVERPVALSPGGFERSRRDGDLNKAGVPGADFDLGDGRLPILLRNADRTPQSGITVEPFVDLPVIHGDAQRAAKLLVQRGGSGTQRLQDAVVD